MRDMLLQIMKDYLLLFPEEQTRQTQFIEYLKDHSDEQVTDWNCFDGHAVASGFVYAKEDQKFLVLYHNDLKLFLSPGGHMDHGDVNPLETAKREVWEETGLKDVTPFPISENNLIPIDLDTHRIPYNQRLDLPEHFHFDFRYLFVVDQICDIKIDTEESSGYQWVEADELIHGSNYGKIVTKINKLLSNR